MWLIAIAGLRSGQPVPAGDFHRRAACRYSDTLTATQTFEAGSGNCLSISNLVVAAARHVGLQARFQDVSVELSWNRVGSLYFMDRHINVLLFGLGDGMHFEVDMLPYPAERSTRSDVVGDATAFAHFYNNLAGEAMARGEDALALTLFRQSLDSDPGLGFVWANLGTLYGRHDQLACRLREDPGRYSTRCPGHPPGNHSAAFSSPAASA